MFGELAPQSCGSDASLIFLHQVLQVVAMPLLHVRCQHLHIFCPVEPSEAKLSISSQFGINVEASIEREAMPVARSQNRLSNIIVNCRQPFEATKFARQSMNRKTCAIIVQGTKNQHGEKIDPRDATPRLPFSKGSKSCRRCLPGILLHLSSQQSSRWKLGPCQHRANHEHHSQVETANHVAIRNSASRGSASRGSANRRRHASGHHGLPRAGPPARHAAVGAKMPGNRQEPKCSGRNLF